MDPGSPPPAGGFVRDDKCGDKSEKIFIMKKTLKIGGIILGVVLFLFVILVIYFNNQIKKGEIFMYEGRWWKKDDWVKIYDPYSKDSPEKDSPEQGLRGFRQGFADYCIGRAFGIITDKHKKESRDSFEK